MGEDAVCSYAFRLTLEELEGFARAWREGDYVWVEPREWVAVAAEARRHDRWPAAWGHYPLLLREVLGHGGAAWFMVLSDGVADEIHPARANVILEEMIKGELKEEEV